MPKRSNPFSYQRKSYYPFSKEYPGQAHSSFAIGETREKRKRERRAQIGYGFFVFFLFVLTFLIVYTVIFLSKRPIPEKDLSSPFSSTELVAVEMPEDALNGGIALDLFLKNLKEANANAVLIPYKAPSGYLAYPSQVQTASDIGATYKSYSAFDESVAQLREKGYKIIAEYSCFADALAAATLPKAAVTLADGQSLWLDESAQKNGNPWLNPYADAAVSYLLSVLAEAPTHGADMVLLSSVQFPTGRFIGEAFYPFAAEKALSGHDVLLEFLGKVKLALPETPFSVQLSVADTLYGNTQKYGGSLLDAPLDFFTVDFKKEAEDEKILLDQHAAFAEFSQKDFLLPAAAAVQSKTESISAKKSVVGILSQENTPQQAKDAGLEHIIFPILPS